ncbi:MAG: CPBP family intramembrane metalloprotease [Ruminococcus sp.]|nr:CPBP family intramembrane metalloprotease [Ruminococcus sp.]
MDNFNGYASGSFNYNPNDDYEFQRREAQRQEACKAERRKLFKNASFLGVLLILYNVFNYVYLYLFYILTYVKYHGGFTLDISEVTSYLVGEQAELVSSSAYSMTANLFLVLMSLVTILIIAQCFMRIGIMDMLMPYKHCFKQGAKWMPACLFINVVLSIIVGIVVEMFEESGVTVPESDFTITEQTTYAVVIQLIYVCIAGPIVEEVIYRGLVIKLLAPYGKGIAIFFSALSFGLMHGNVSQAIPAFCGGLVYAMVAVKYNSIVPTIVIHFLNNLLASITDIGDVFNFDGAYTIYNICTIAVMIAGLYVIMVNLDELKNDIKKSEPVCALPSGARTKALYTNIFVIIYLLMLVWSFVESFIYYN